MAELGPPIKFNSLQEVRDYAKRSDRDLLLLDDTLLDVTTFAPHHPGGSLLLRSRRGQDIAEVMQWHHPLTLTMASTMAVGSFRKEIERVITPERGFMGQIWALSQEEYMRVVHSPHWLFVPSPRMFDSPFLELFTHCRWYMALLMPALVIAYMLAHLDAQYGGVQSYLRTIGIDGEELAILRDMLTE